MLGSASTHLATCSHARGVGKLSRSAPSIEYKRFVLNRMKPVTNGFMSLELPHSMKASGSGLTLIWANLLARAVDNDCAAALSSRRFPAAHGHQPLGNSKSLILRSRIIW